jgi:hypothetical protein
MIIIITGTLSKVEWSALEEHMGFFTGMVLDALMNG